MAARNVEWLNAVQRQHGCTFMEAKRIYASGNGTAPTNGTLSIDALTALAQATCDRIHNQIVELNNRADGLQAELGRWLKVRDAVQSSEQAFVHDPAQSPTT